MKHMDRGWVYMGREILFVRSFAFFLRHNVLLRRCIHGDWGLEIRRY